MYGNLGGLSARYEATMKATEGRRSNYRRKVWTGEEGWQEAETRKQRNRKVVEELNDLVARAALAKTW